jgi:hypothetical protein
MRGPLNLLSEEGIRLFFEVLIFTILYKMIMNTKKHAYSSHAFLPKDVIYLGTTFCYTSRRCFTHLTHKGRLVRSGASNPKHH